MRNLNKQRTDRHVERKCYELTQKWKGIQCREREEFSYIQAEYANTLKKNRSLNTTLSNDEKEETDFNEGNDTVAFTVVVDMKDTSMHRIGKSVEDYQSTYSDEEDKKVTFDELQDKYNLMYISGLKLLKLTRC